MKPKKYILRQPESVSAIIWDGENVDDIVKFMQHDTLDVSVSMNSNTLKVGSMKIPLGDYIVYDPADGTFRQYAAEDFTTKYKLKRADNGNKKQLR